MTIERMRELQRRWYHAHKEHYRQRYLANREEILRRQRERWASLTPEQKRDIYIRRVIRETEN